MRRQAAHARELADGLYEESARQCLLDYAAELEREAQAIEAKADAPAIRNGGGTK